MLNFFSSLKVLQKIAFITCFLVIVSVGMSTITWRLFSALEDTRQWTDHSYVVLGKLKNILSAMIDQETGVRGYLLSGNDKFLEPFQAGAKRYGDELAEVRRLTSDNPGQQQRLSEMDGSAQSWMRDIAGKEITLMGDAKTQEDARKMETSGAGKAAMDGIRAKVREISNAEESLLAERAQLAKDTATHSQLVVLIGIAIMFAVLFISLYFYNAILVRPLISVTKALKDIANGDLTNSQHVSVKSNDEIKDLVDALTRMTGNLRATADLANTISRGDLTVEPKPLSDKDTLGLALVEMTKNLRSTVGVADAIARGDLQSNRSRYRTRIRSGWRSLQ